MDSNMIPISMETPICVGDIYSTHKYILMKMISKVVLLFLDTLLQ